MNGVTHALVASLTADTPRWLFLVVVGIAVAAYATCGALTLAARHRLSHRASAATRTVTTRPRAEITS